MKRRAPLHELKLIFLDQPFPGNALFLFNCFNFFPEQRLDFARFGMTLERLLGKDQLPIDHYFKCPPGTGQQFPVLDEVFKVPVA